MNGKWPLQTQLQGKDGLFGVAQRGASARTLPGLLGQENGPCQGPPGFQQNPTIAKMAWSFEEHVKPRLLPTCLRCALVVHVLPLRSRRRSTRPSLPGEGGDLHAHAAIRATSGKSGLCPSCRPDVRALLLERIRNTDGLRHNHRSRPSKLHKSLAERRLPLCSLHGRRTERWQLLIRRHVGSLWRLQLPGATQQRAASA